MTRAPSRALSRARYRALSRARYRANPRGGAALLLGLSLLAGCRSEAPREQVAGGDETTTVSVEQGQGDPVRGRIIYVQGKSPSGAKIEAVLAGDVIIDAATMPCVGCHGEHGHGVSEGGMEPSDITWEQLSKPYGGRSPSGREHGPYDLAGLRKAVGMGVDPSGNQITPTMPRYRMSRTDLDDLAAYLQVLGQQTTAGVGEASIAVLSVMSRADPSADAVEAALRAYLSELARRGGIFGRTLELEVLRLPSEATPEQLAATLRDALEQRPPLAVLAPRLGEGLIEAALLQTLAEAEVPVIGPATNYPEPSRPPRPNVFYVDGGIPAQAMALAAYAQRRREQDVGAAPELGDAPARALVLHPARDRELAETVLASWPAPVIMGERVEQELPTSEPPVELDDADILLLLGPAAGVRPLLEQLAGSVQPDRIPNLILVPGSLAIGDPFSLPAALDGHLLLAYPWLPDDIAARALQDYEALAKTHALPARHVTAQLAALNAGAMLLEGLARSGRGVTRSSLIDTLERLRDFTTGLTPPLTYGPNRRIGLDHAVVVHLDLAQAKLVRAE